MAHGEASLFSRSALGGWPSDRRGWLQIGVGGFRLSLLKIGFGWVAFRSTWVAPDRNGWLQIGVGGFRPEWVVGGRGGVGSRGVVDGHGWPWVLLLVGVSWWLEFQRCFNGVSGWIE